MISPLVFKLVYAINERISTHSGEMKNIWFYREGLLLIMVTKRVLVYGKVQGVYFRVYTKDMADLLGLKGWVQNLPDGRVEALFQGSDENITKMLAWCRQGSPNARVDRLQVEDLNAEPDHADFSIIA
jgi:acylphosphatase